MLGRSAPGFMHRAWRMLSSAHRRLPAANQLHQGRGPPWGQGIHCNTPAAGPAARTRPPAPLCGRPRASAPARRAPHPTAAAPQLAPPAVGDYPLCSPLWAHAVVCISKSDPRFGRLQQAAGVAPLMHTAPCVCAPSSGSIPAPVAASSCPKPVYSTPATQKGRVRHEVWCAAPREALPHPPASCVSTRASYSRGKHSSAAPALPSEHSCVTTTIHPCAPVADACDLRSQLSQLHASCVLGVGGNGNGPIGNGSSMCCAGRRPSNERGRRTALHCATWTHVAAASACTALSALA